MMSNLTGFVKRIRDIMCNDAGINGDAQRIEQMAWMLFLKVYDAKEQDWEFNDDSYESIIPDNCRWSNWAHDDKSGSAMLCITNMLLHDIDTPQIYHDNSLFLSLRISSYDTIFLQLLSTNPTKPFSFSIQTG